MKERVEGKGSGSLNLPMRHPAYTNDLVLLVPYIRIASTMRDDLYWLPVRQRTFILFKQYYWCDEQRFTKSRYRNL